MQAELGQEQRLAILPHIVPAHGGKVLKDAGPEDVTALHHELRDRPVAVNQAVRMLSKMFALAENRGMVPAGRRPAGHVRRYRESSRERSLTPEEYQHLGATLSRLEVEGSIMPCAVVAILSPGSRTGSAPAMSGGGQFHKGRLPSEVRSARTGRRPNIIRLTAP